MSDIKVLKPNKLVAVISYLIFMFVIGTVLLYIFSFAFAKNNSALNYNDLIKYMSDSTYKVDNVEEYKRASSLVYGLSNLISYGLSFIFVVFYLRDELKNSFFNLKENRWLFIYIPASSVIFCGLAYLVDFLIGLAAPSSTNQTLIETIMRGPGLVPMIISTVILAPVIEELIYRHVIFHYAKRYSIVASYLISIILFTLPHMLTSKIDNFGIWILQCVPYIVSGGLLCLVYHKSKFNIYASITAHMLNNILAVILVFTKGI